MVSFRLVARMDLPDFQAIFWPRNPQSCPTVPSTAALQRLNLSSSNLTSCRETTLQCLRPRWIVDSSSHEILKLPLESAPACRGKNLRGMFSEALPVQFCGGGSVVASDDKMIAVANKIRPECPRHLNDLRLRPCKKPVSSLSRPFLRP